MPPQLPGEGSPRVEQPWAAPGARGPAAAKEKVAARPPPPQQGLPTAAAGKPGLAALQCRTDAGGGHGGVSGGSCSPPGVLRTHPGPAGPAAAPPGATALATGHITAPGAGRDPTFSSPCIR